MKKNYRRCISCRRVAAKEDFWRVVRIHSSRTVELDNGMGRSAYICPQKSCLIGAKQKKRLQKTLKIAVSEQIYRILENRLKEQQSENIGE